MIYRKRYKIILSIVLLITMGQASGNDVRKPTFVTSFGRGSFYTNGELDFPSGVTADNNGNVYVCDERGRLTKFDSDGNFITKWTSGCVGVGVDNNGDVYAAEGQRIRVYNSDGTQLREWGSNGSGDGQFRGAKDVAVDDIRGRVYVVDTRNFRVQVFDTSGNYITQWGSEGTGDGQFSGPRGPMGITVDENSGNVYVADTEAMRIQKFNQDGAFLLKWGGAVSNCQGFIKWPRDVEVDSNELDSYGEGYVYEADTDAERIQKFDSQGNFIMEFQGLHNPTDGPHHSRSVAVGSTSGNFYIYSAAAYAKRIDKFYRFVYPVVTTGFSPADTNPGTAGCQPDGFGHPADGKTGVQGYGSENYLTSFGFLESGNGVLNSPAGIAIDAQNGFLYIADTGNFMIQKFDTDGNFEKHFGFSGRVRTMYTGGNTEANFDFPSTLTTDANGNVYVVREDSQYGGDPQVNRIQKIDGDGNLLMTWNYNDFIEGMKGIVYNPVNDYIYVSNTPRHKIQYFDTSGTFKGEFGGYGSADGKFNSPARIAVDKNNGNLYVVDVNNSRIQKFLSNGGFITKWGINGTGDGEFKFTVSSGIYVDKNGYVYVADTGNNRIQVFDSNGGFILKWGTWGWGDENFVFPQGIVVDSNGFIYVLDTGRNSVQKFTSMYPDGDGDGYTSYIDCNDNNPAVHPGATELCNGIDDNCNSQIDEGFLMNTYYRDADGDGYGDLLISTQACAQPPGYVADSTDCNDSDPNVYPGAAEICDGIDNNCNSQIDEGFLMNTYYRDADGDGYGNSLISTQACAQPIGYVVDNTDCNDGDPNIHPGGLPVRILRITPAYFSTLQAAYDATGGGETIQSQDVTLTENVNINLNKSVILEGGYDCGYTTNTGITSLIGTLTISSGAVTVKNFNLSQ